VINDNEIEDIVVMNFQYLYGTTIMEKENKYVKEKAREKRMG
jgi:hypothetical protein